MRALQRLTTISCALGLLLGVRAASAQTFQFGKTPTGTVRRPVLLILTDFTDRRFGASASGPRNALFFSQLFSGPAFPNVRDYFLEASGGQFTYMPIGVLGPITFPDDPTTPTANESTFGCWKDATDAAGRVVCPGSSRTDATQISELVRLASTRFNIGAYDTNNDGIVSESELTLVFVTSGDNGGKTRGGCGPLPGGKRYCGITQFFGESANFGTITHEMIHAFSNVDLYGPWAGPVKTNGWLTVMGGTVTGIDERWTILPDAWHRTVLGWTRPRVVPSSGGCFYLDGAAKGGANAGPNRAPLAIPIDGDKEFFLVEHRAQRGYDADFARSPNASGVVVWHVKNDASGSPLNVPYSIFLKQGQTMLSARAMVDDMLVPGSAIVWGPDHVLQSTPGANDDLGSANWVLAATALPTPVGAGFVYSTGAFGTGTPLVRAHGRISLLRPGGASTGLSLDVGDDVDGTVPVRFTGTSAPNGSGACLQATEPRVQHPSAMLIGPGCADFAGTSSWVSTSQRLSTLKVALAAPAVVPIVVRIASSNAAVRIPAERTIPVGARELVVDVMLAGGQLTSADVVLTVTVEYPATAQLLAKSVVLTSAMRLAPSGQTTCSTQSQLAAAGPSLAALVAQRTGNVPRPSPPPIRTIPAQPAFVPPPTLGPTAPKLQPVPRQGPPGKP